MKKYIWVDADYWQVHNDKDRELFRGSPTACKKFAKKNGGTVAHVILERKEQTL